MSAGMQEHRRALQGYSDLCMLRSKQCTGCQVPLLAKQWSNTAVPWPEMGNQSLMGVTAPTHDKLENFRRLQPFTQETPFTWIGGGKKPAPVQTPCEHNMALAAQGAYRVWDVSLS